MSSKFFGNKHTKAEPKKQGRTDSKGKGASKQLRKAGRGK